MDAPVVIAAAVRTVAQTSAEKLDQIDPLREWMDAQARP